MAALNPFHSHSNASLASYAQQSRRRAFTPAPGHSGFGTSASHHQRSNGGMAGYLDPAQVNLGPEKLHTRQHGKRRSETPEIGQSQAQQYGASLRRPQSAQVRGSSGSEQSSRSGSNMRGMKVRALKERRSFFKNGRVFKALWTQPSERNNPFTETLRFVVLRAHTHYSICLAIHSYGNKATTARNVRPREHLVIYSGDNPPELVEGESEAVLARPPIQITLDPSADPLRPTSRLAISKLHTVEHNVPVAIIGKIAPHDVNRLRQYSAEALGAAPPSTTDSLHDLDEEDEQEE